MATDAKYLNCDGEQVANEAGEDDYYNEEEEDVTEADSIDDEEDRKEFGIYQCLPVDDREPDWSTEEPLTVEEYLRRVRYEARKLPSVVTSDIEVKQDADSSTLESMVPSIRATIQDCPPEYKPSSRWLRDFLDNFATLRRQLHKEQQMITGQVDGLPLRVVLPPSPSDKDASSGQQQEGVPLDSPSNLMPELAELRGVDQVTVLKQAHGVMKAAMDRGAVGPEDAAAIYAVSLRIEKPIHGDVCALYRSLLRSCAAQRAALTDARHHLLPHLNILIAIAGAYFGQDEDLAALWEEKY